jgi:hypothetical protein
MSVLLGLLWAEQLPLLILLLQALGLLELLFYCLIIVLK